MDTETHKHNFINLLRDEYLANIESRKENPLLEIVESNDEVISIDNSTLIKFGFGDRDFWERLCPSLKNKGILKAFEDPRVMMYAAFKETSDYKRMEEEIAQLKKLSNRQSRVRDRIDKLNVELEKQEEHFNKNYQHSFTVDKEALFEEEKSEYYITRTRDVFYLNDARMNLNLKHDYAKAFETLFEIVPKGGDCMYEDYEKSFKKRYIKTYKKILRSKTKGFIAWARQNLTESGRGISKVTKIDGLVITKNRSFSFRNRKN